MINPRHIVLVLCVCLLAQSWANGRQRQLNVCAEGFSQYALGVSIVVFFSGRYQVYRSSTAAKYSLPDSSSSTLNSCLHSVLDIAEVLIASLHICDQMPLTQTCGRFLYFKRISPWLQISIRMEFGSLNYTIP